MLVPQEGKKCAIFNRAINMHSRGLMGQCFYIWEPFHWYLRAHFFYLFEVLIVEGQQSNKYAFLRDNRAINTHS